MGVSENPTQKSIELERWVIRQYSSPGEAVFSMCCGSGSTLVASALEGRPCIGVDTNINLANSRVQVFSKRQRNELIRAGLRGNDEDRQRADLEFQKLNVPPAETDAAVWYAKIPADTRWALATFHARMFC